MDTEKKIKIAILGAGRIATHYRDLFISGDLSDFEIVGVCDVKQDAAAALAAHFGAPSYSDFDGMLTSVEPDLVLVLTPSGHHFTHAKTALMRGCNVLVEKPATMFPAESLELVKIAKKNNLMYGVAFQNRLNPTIELLRRELEAGRFGKIVTATVRVRWCRYQAYYEDGWHGTWSYDGGVINQQAIHHVDALNWLIGPIEEVCALKGNRLNALEAEDTMVAIVRYANGAMGTIEATTAARPSDIEASLSVVGEYGVAVIGGIALNRVDTWQFVHQKPEDKHVIRDYSYDVPNGYGLSHKVLLQKVIRSLQSGLKVPPVSVEESIITNQIIHALYASSEIGKWVRLSDNLLSQKLGRTKGDN